MPKTKISEYSATANSNTDVASINIDEGCAPSGINNAIRAIMGHLKDFQSGTSNDPFTVGSSGSLTLSYGTANGVAYLNGSKVLTTGSALSFDGTNLGVGAGYITATNTSNTTVAAAGFDATTSSSLRVVNASTTAGTGAGIYFVGGGNSESWIGNLYESSGVGALSFQTRVSGTRAERMRIDSSGNLLVGNSTDPIGSNRLLVQSAGTANNNRAFSVYNTAATSTTAFANRLMQLSSNASGADVSIQFTDQTAYNAYIGMGSGALYFATNGSTEKMRLDASGNLLVGTTSSTNLQNNYSFLVGGNLPGAGSACFNGQNGNTVLQVNQTLDDNADRGQIYFYRNESLIGKITSSNTVTLFTSLSDYRLKNTIVPMTGALAKVALLKPCTYKWNSDNSDGQGFIAHELAEVFPLAVSGEKDAVDSEGNLDYQGVDTSVLVATLTAAIQELNAKFEEYKATHP